MRNKEKKETESGLINSVDQAKISIDLLLEKDQKKELEQGIYVLLNKLDNSEVNELFDNYPSLLQKYGVKELFSGNANIPNFSQKSLKIAGLLTCIQFLIPSCKEFSDRSGNMIPFVEIQNNNSFKPIKYIIGSISKDDFIEDLFILLITVVGTDYYKKFIEKTGNSNFTTEDILTLDENPELQEHIDLIAWFALIRLFLESMYYYFNPENHNPKNHLQ